MGSKRRWIGRAGRSVGTARGRYGARERPQREMPRPVPVRQRSRLVWMTVSVSACNAFTRFPCGCEMFDLFPTLFLGCQSRPQEFVSRARRLDIVSCWVPCTMFSADTSASPTVWLLILFPLAIHNFVTNCFGHVSQIRTLQICSCWQHVLAIPCPFSRQSVFIVFWLNLINYICRSNSCHFQKIRFLRAEVILAGTWYC